MQIREFRVGEATRSLQFVPSSAKISHIDKLNVIAPYVREIQLSSNKVLDFCVSVIEYAPGVDDSILDLSFNNGDSSSFINNDYIEYDGVMKVKTSYVFPVNQDVGTPSVYESDAVIIANFTTIDSLVMTESELNIVAYPGAQIATPNSFIDFSNIEKMNFINIVSNKDVGAVLKYAIDFGLGEVIYDGTDWVSISDISTEGMTAAEMNALTSEQLEAGRDSSNNFMVIYYLDPITSVGVANNDSIVVEVELKAVPEISTTADYSLSFNETTSIATVTITKDGTYRINYVGGEE